MSAGLQRSRGVDQLLLKRKEDGTIKILIAKFTEELLLVGTRKEKEGFMNTIKIRFHIRK